jgi:hypothetical protein
LKVTVANEFASKVIEQGFTLLAVLQPPQLTNVDPAVGVAVRVTTVPTGNAAPHGIVRGVQLRAVGALTTVPEPVPANVTASCGPAPVPVPVKQVTFAVILPVTRAPEDEIPPILLFVLTVAEMRVPPQESPVAVIKPVAFTVTICGVFEFQVTWSVMSFVTGG